MDKVALPNDCSDDSKRFGRFDGLHTVASSELPIKILDVEAYRIDADLEG